MEWLVPPDPLIGMVILVTFGFVEPMTWHYFSQSSPAKPGGAAYLSCPVTFTSMCIVCNLWKTRLRSSQNVRSISLRNKKSPSRIFIVETYFFRDESQKLQLESRHGGFVKVFPSCTVITVTAHHVGHAGHTSCARKWRTCHAKVPLTSCRPYAPTATERALRWLPRAAWTCFIYFSLISRYTAERPDYSDPKYTLKI